MLRDRALKTVLVIVGLLFSAGVYPAVSALWNHDHSDTGDTMMMGIYATLGVFVLLAVRNPSAHRSLIAFAAWSSFAHALVMSLLAFQIPSDRDGFLVGSAILAAIGILLLVLFPAKPSAALSPVATD